MSLTRTLRQGLWQNIVSARKNVGDRNLTRMISSSASTKEAQKAEEKKQPESSATDLMPAPALNRARFVYPEFLPDPKMEWRNLIREKLERSDMMKRRRNIDIPEFYVGSVLAVTSSHVHAQRKVSRFVGICIQRQGCGLRSRFVLRNIIDNLGCEIEYYMYDPTIQKIDVLKLEKRPDRELLYLRDALPEYSTFPLDMEPIPLPEGSPVPVNDIKVKMKGRPWTQKWEKKGLLGVEKLEISQKNLIRMARAAKPWEKHDLMLEYRKTIPEEEQKEIFSEVYSELHQLELTRRKMKRKRMFVKPVKSA
ncbi:hypothetical protein LSTR_LSTR011416 [Laodelphax striatellus]|uniref:Large ribosomal subunit protein bL19m n=1 Tax=Laodelphax striatellus TaxID=195883 RepID=A0A482WNW5_LAOST|nr:hypothetical protein LSTR_LSTR011416 [Laodelphax striatellus]